MTEEECQQRIKKPAVLPEPTPKKITLQKPLKQVLIVELPYPDPKLSPNRKNGTHWGATKKVKDKARNDAFLMATQAMAGFKFADATLLSVSIMYIQKDKRHRDLDNLLAASKPMLDGIAKAIGVDDKIFAPITIMRQYSNFSGMTVRIE